MGMQSSAAMKYLVRKVREDDPDHIKGNAVAGLGWLVLYPGEKMGRAFVRHSVALEWALGRISHAGNAATKG